MNLIDLIQVPSGRLHGSQIVWRLCIKWYSLHRGSRLELRGMLQIGIDGRWQSCACIACAAFAWLQLALSAPRCLEYENCNLLSQDLFLMYFQSLIKSHTPLARSCWGIILLWGIRDSIRGRCSLTCCLQAVLHGQRWEMLFIFKWRASYMCFVPWTCIERGSLFFSLNKSEFLKSNHCTLLVFQWELFWTGACLGVSLGWEWVLGLLRTSYILEAGLVLRYSWKSSLDPIWLPAKLVTVAL